VSAATGLNGVVPSGWDKARREVRKGSDDEQPVAHRWVRHLEEACGGPGIDRCGERQARGRAFDREPRSAEDQQVQVELAWAPAPALSSAERALEVLERDEELGGAGRRIGSRRHVEGDDGVEEVGLVCHADGLRAVEAGGATEASAGHGCQRRHGVGQRAARVADVRPEADVRPNRSTHAHLDRSRCRPGYSRRVHHVAVRILHPPTRDDAGELTRLVGRARSIAAEDLARRFESAGAEDVAIVSGDDEVTFGERLRGVVVGLEPGSGVVVLGSGSIPLATDSDLCALVNVARSGEPRALTNNRYSSDVVAIGSAAILASVPDLGADNHLPRWLITVAGVAVAELPDRARLAMDIDSPLDLELIRRDPSCPRPLAELATSMAHRLARAAEAFDALATLARDPSKELFVAGRLSATTLRDLEEHTACRIRALVEERGLRASAALSGSSAAGDDGGADGDEQDDDDGSSRQRQPASLLGLLLDRDGPGSIGAVVHGLADGAAIDTRVLLAHRHGPDEAAWPSPEDRYASDLLLADRVRDPWLQQLTLHTWSHAIPIALGGHSLVGPGLRLALGLDR
jgi:hypothetical protein